MIVKPGLRDVVQVAGFGESTMLTTRPPSSVKLTPEFEETVTYFLDSSAQVDRPLKWTDASTASPDVARRWTIELEWDSLSQVDYRKLLTMQAVPAPAGAEFKVCVWRPIVETFTCDGVRNSFKLSAVPAVSTAGAAYLATPPQGYANYTTVVYVNGAVTAVTVAAQTFTSTRTVGQILQVYYVPVFLCRRSGAECRFEPATIEGLRLELETIA